MTNMTYISSERIIIRNTGEETRAFMLALFTYLNDILEVRGPGYLSRVKIDADGVPYVFEWDDTLGGDIAADIQKRISRAAQLNVRIDMSGQIGQLLEKRDDLFAMLSDGALRDRVWYSILTEDDGTAALVFSGLYHGAFLHGAVPFTVSNEDILVHTRWNGSSHHARFEVAEAQWSSAEAIMDRLEQTLNIDILQDGHAITIEQVSLDGLEEVRLYHSSLEELARISLSSEVSGYLCAEGEDAFALLRFIPIGNAIQLQTAVIDAQ